MEQFMMGGLIKKMNDNWITPQEAVELSGYHIKHIRRLLNAGKIDGKKWGRDWMVNRPSLLNYRELEGRKPKKNAKV